MEFPDVQKSLIEYERKRNVKHIGWRVPLAAFCISTTVAIYTLYQALQSDNRPNVNSDIAAQSMIGYSNIVEDIIADVDLCVEFPSSVVINEVYSDDTNIEFYNSPDLALIQNLDLSRAILGGDMPSIDRHNIFIVRANTTPEFENIGEAEIYQILKDKFSGLPVNFSYFEGFGDMPIGMFRNKTNATQVGFLSQDQIHLLRDRIGGMFGVPIDSIVVLNDLVSNVAYNTNDIIFLPRTGPNTPATAIHEAAHQLGLDDAYIYPGVNDTFEEIANNSEFIVGPENGINTGDITLDAAILLTKPQLVFQGETCDGEKVYRVNPTDGTGKYLNIMQSPNINATFTDIQIRYMNMFVVDRLKKEKRISAN